MLSRSTERPLTDQEVLDLTFAFLNGEMSEGFLQDVLYERNGLDGDQVRALWFDPVQRGSRLANEYVSKRALVVAESLKATSPSSPSSQPKASGSSSQTENK